LLSLFLAIAVTWPTSGVRPAARVQRQHPNTGLIGQAKFIDTGERSVALCQDSSHIGVLLTTAAVDAAKGPLEDGAYWRREWTESFPERGLQF
jgi:hypothetical protein